MTAYQKKIADYYLASFESYQKDVISGKRFASAAETAKVLRHQNDLKREAFLYHFDPKEAVRPLVWMACYLCYPKGEKRGQAFKLAPWQVFDLMVLFGWMKKGSKERRFVDGYMQIARKNGKSTLAAAVIDYLAFGEVEGAVCYIGATSLDQADETFSRASEMLKLNGRLKGVQIANSKNNKVIKWGSGMIKAISAEPKDGKLAYGTIIDEYHPHRSNDLFNSILSGNVSDQQTMLLRITTAGTDLNGCCHEEYEKAKKVLSGDNSLDRYFVSIYEQDDFDDIEDPKIWTKSNPNLGISVDLEKLRANFDNARLSMTELTDFKTKNLNLWCYGSTSWVNLPIWKERCHWEVDEEQLEGAPAYGGLDLSSVSDFTAFTMTFNVGGRYFQKTHYWIAEGQKKVIARQCSIPLDRWIDEGWITAIPGDVIDYEYVAEYLNGCYERYKIVNIAADRWRLQDLARVMPPWFESVAYEFSQGMKTMDPTIRDFEREYLVGNVSCGSDPVMDWMMQCATIFQDTNGNVKIVKPKDRTGKRIDGVITSIMALDCCKTFGVEGMESGDLMDMISFF